MSKQEKATKRFIHSLYENVSQYAKSICGVYINVDDFKDGQEHVVEWTANIPFDNFLVLQAFDLFPNFAIPNVELRCYVSEDGFVYCPLDPHYVYDVKTLIQEETIKRISFSVGEDMTYNVYLSKDNTLNDKTKGILLNSGSSTLYGIKSIDLENVEVEDNFTIIVEYIVPTNNTSSIFTTCDYYDDNNMNCILS